MVYSALSQGERSGFGFARVGGVGGVAGVVGFGEVRALGVLGELEGVADVGATAAVGEVREVAGVTDTWGTGFFRVNDNLLGLGTASGGKRSMTDCTLYS